MKNHKNKAFRTIIMCAVGFFAMITTQETAQAQQVTARTLDSWLQKHASPAQKSRYQDFHKKVRDYFLKQNWSPNRKYNRAQAEYAAYKLIRSPQYSASYLRLIKFGHSARVPMAPQPLADGVTMAGHSNPSRTRFIGAHGVATLIRAFNLRKKYHSGRSRYFSIGVGIKAMEENNRGRAPLLGMLESFGEPDWVNAYWKNGVYYYQFLYTRHGFLDGITKKKYNVYFGIAAGKTHNSSGLIHHDFTNQ